MELLFNQSWVNGQWQPASSGATYPVLNPANGEKLADVSDFSASDTRAAIELANQAFAEWKQTTAQQRSRIINKWFQLIMENQEALAQLMTAECGKPLTESRVEVAYGASFVEWFAEEAKRAYGDIIPEQSKDRRLLVIKQPVGVCAAITPWNFPLAMITRKCAPALAAGCSVVVKPAEATPLTALALGYLGSEAGLPAGVFNVVTASHGAEVGQEMSTNPLVRKVSFTGSTAVGKLLLKQSADTVKKVSMELGGNAPFIVFDDADIDAAVEGAIASKYRNSGQTCVCANRLMVQDGVYEEFVEKFAKASAALKVAAGNAEGSQIGPLINEAALQKVESLVADATAKGARAVTGGRVHELGGTFYEPTVLADVTSEMLIAQQEIFGPVAPVYRFQKDQEAIDMSNDTNAGLAAYFYSQNLSRIWQVSEQLEYGMVGINAGIIANEVVPFGGVKESGLGREGSKYGMDEFTELKYLCMGGIQPL